MFNHQWRFEGVIQKKYGDLTVHVYDWLLLSQTNMVHAHSFLKGFQIKVEA